MYYRAQTQLEMLGKRSQGWIQLQDYNLPALDPKHQVPHLPTDYQGRGEKTGTKNRKEKKDQR